MAVQNEDSGVYTAYVLKIMQIANVNKKGANGTTPLFFSVKNGYADICIAFLQNNKNFKKRGGNGATPLFMAARNGDADVCTVLL